MQLASETEPTISMGSCSANTRFPSQSNSWTVHGYTKGLYEMPSLLHSGSCLVFYQNIAVIKILEACIDLKTLLKVDQNEKNEEVRLGPEEFNKEL